MDNIKKRKKKLSYADKIVVNISLNIEILDQFIQYVFIDPESNPYINRKSLSNLNELLNIIDKREYESDEAIIARIVFLQRVLKLELKDNIFTFEMLLSKSLDGSHNEEIQNTIVPFLRSDDVPPLTINEIKYINKYVEERLKYSYLYLLKDKFELAFQDLTLNNFESIADINETFERLTSELVNNIRKSKLTDDEEADIDFSDDGSWDAITEISKKLKKPTNFLKTGIINLNKMLRGGFESGRVYIFMGITGGFKSGILLNAFYWMKEYNKEFKPKDPNKIPTVLYLTQENSKAETIERLWNIACSDKDIREFSNKKIVKKFKEAVEVQETSPINLVIKYLPNKAISTDDLYNIFDDYNDRGREIICVIHDYTKRIRPSRETGELRLDLANVIDEETVFAKEKNIPFITAAQLNRKAMEVIEEALQKGKNNAIDKLGASNVGESWGILENADWVGLINMEEVSDQSKPDIPPKKYLTIKQLKMRGKKPSSIKSFVHPFYEENGMKLFDDEKIGRSMSLSSLESYGPKSEAFSEPKKKKQTIDRRQLSKEVDEVDLEMEEDVL